MKWIPNGELAKRIFARLRPIEAITWQIPVPYTTPVTPAATPTAAAVDVPNTTKTTTCVETIVKEFITKIEQDDQIVGYYYKDAAGKEHTFYELFKLSTVVTGITQDLSGKWAKTWKMDEIQQAGYIVKPEKTNTWFVTAEHFLFFCMKQFKASHLNAYGAELVKRIPKTVNMLAHPTVAVNADHGILTARDNNTMNEYTIEEAVGKITSLVYLHQYFEYHMAKLGYTRRVYGDQNNLYEGKHIVHVAGPYGRSVEAEESLKTLEMTVRGGLHISTSGHVTLQIGKKETLFLSLGNFLSLSLSHSLTHLRFRLLRQECVQGYRQRCLMCSCQCVPCLWRVDTFALFEWI